MSRRPLPVHNEPLRNQHPVQVVSIVGGDTEMLETVACVVIRYLQTGVEQVQCMRPVAAVY